MARGLPDQDRKILEYHDAIAKSKLPMILFYLYERAGGISYSQELLDELLSRETTLGIKLATLDSVMTFQEVTTLVRERHPDKVVITGEDRFLGYSLMCGAQAALIGMGTARSRLQSELLESHFSSDASRFLSLSAAVDDLARHTFIEPMEGYIQRMLWCLVHDGVIPIEAAHDPWGPPLDPAEFEVIGACLRRLPTG
jgi:4-hydroxy-tetrahydrodipicolinate synthase